MQHALQHHLPEKAREIPSPSLFTFPFYYETHPLCLLAAEQLQAMLLADQQWVEYFAEGDRGKMFGVLVVEDELQNRSYLAAYSGSLDMKLQRSIFVPNIYNAFEEDTFFDEGVKRVTALTTDLASAESDPRLEQCRAELEGLRIQSEERIHQQKAKMKFAKKERDALRKQAQGFPAPERSALEQKLIKESVGLKTQLRKIQEEEAAKQARLEGMLHDLESSVNALREQRAQLSNSLQERLFGNFEILNGKNERSDLLSIFKAFGDLQPPAGSGDCAAPKLLHYAYEHGLKPICMAEFWWGTSPKGEVRKHKMFYPACRSKCEPILGFMLQGLDVEDNQIGQEPDPSLSVEVIYEDEQIAIINKPSGLLSVPGRTVSDSVSERLKSMFPSAENPLVTHRLDMHTSGLMIVAKDLGAYKYIQRQFIKRRVQKRYVALLDGTLIEDEGVIELPLRLDVNDRPRQMVDHELGKASVTHWKKEAEVDGKTRVLFFPKTGRTHQLRVHAAHQEGLDTAIVGDDLYGTKADRLHLHAEKVTFMHPATREILTFQLKAPF